MALIASSYGVVLAVVLELWAPKNAFVYILSGALFGLMLSWMVSLLAHVSFRHRMSNSQLTALPMHAPLGAFGSALGFTLVTAAVIRTWWDSRVSLISGVSTLLILTVAYFFLKSGESGSAGL